jgi:hypothetical protein
MSRRLWRALRPQLVYKPVGWHHLAHIEDQEGKNGTFKRSGQPDCFVFCRHRQRPDYAKLHVGFHEVWSVLTKSGHTLPDG